MDSENAEKPIMSPVPQGDEFKREMIEEKEVIAGHQDKLVTERLQRQNSNLDKKVAGIHSVSPLEETKNS